MGFKIIKEKRTSIFIKRIVGVIVYNMFKVFPRNNKVIVFGSQNGKDIGDNPKFIYNEMKKKTSYKFIWILKNKSNVLKNMQEGYECYYYKSLKGIYYQLRAKTFIHSHSINDDFLRVLLGGATSINTWHGVGLKKVWGENKKTYTYQTFHEKSSIKKFLKMQVVKTNIAKYNYVISTSKRVSSYYPTTFLVDKQNVLELGQARNDVFYTEEKIQSKFLDYLKNNKVILYMPTHRDFGKKDDNITNILKLDKIEEICDKYNYKFVIKKHMYSSLDSLKDYKNIVEISNWQIDTQLILKYSDILITDYSSCYTDYLLLNRPVIFYCYDLNEYLSGEREMYFDYDEVTPGEKVKNFKKLEEVISKTIEGQDLFEQERKRVLNIFYSPKNHNKVTKKQVEYIINNIIEAKGRD